MVLFFIIDLFDVVSKNNKLIYLIKKKVFLT